MSKAFHTPAHVIYVCTGDKCKKRGGKELSRLFRDLIKEHHLKNKVEVIKTAAPTAASTRPTSSSSPRTSGSRKCANQKPALLSTSRFSRSLTRRNRTSPKKKQAPWRQSHFRVALATHI